jgi:hypothetical protein
MRKFKGYEKFIIQMRSAHSKCESTNEKLDVPGWYGGPKHGEWDVNKRKPNADSILVKGMCYFHGFCVLLQ